MREKERETERWVEDPACEGSENMRPRGFSAAGDSYARDNSARVYATAAAPFFDLRCCCGCERAGTRQLRWRGRFTKARCLVEMRPSYVTLSLSRSHLVRSQRESTYSERGKVRRKCEPMPLMDFFIADGLPVRAAKMLCLRGYRWLGIHKI